MKRRGWLWLIASVLLAVLAGVIAIVALGRAASRVAVTTPPQGQAVVVARQPIAANSILRVDNVTVEERQATTAGAATRVQDVLGQTTIRDLAEGEVILVSDVVNLGASAQLTGTQRIGQLLGNDMIAVALQADDMLSGWGAVAPGDHVDVLWTMDIVVETAFPVLTPNPEGETPPQVERDQSLDNASVLTLQNLEVLAIVEQPQAEAAAQTQNNQQAAEAAVLKRALILKCSPQDAVILKYMRDAGDKGKIDLALRSPTNNTLFKVDAVNINYLVLRYGIVLPQPVE